VAVEDHRPQHGVGIARQVLEEWRGLAREAKIRTGGRRLVRELLSELDRQIRLRSSPEPEVVAVLLPNEAVGLELDAVFWLGLVEGEFPVSMQGGLLNDEEAGTLNSFAQAEIWPRPSRPSSSAARSPRRTSRRRC